MSNFNFKSSGKKFGRSENNKATIKNNIDDELEPFGILTPLQLSQDDKSSLFKMSFDITDQIRDNLRNLLLTSPGERLGRYDYGAGLRDLTFEMIAQNNDYESKIMEVISENVGKYMPYVNLKTLTTEDVKIETVSSDRPLAKLILEIKYEVPALSLTNQKIVLVLYVAG